MRIAYIGVMNSIGQPDNGFTKAMHKLGAYREFTRVEDIDNVDLLFLQTQDTGLNVKELSRLRNQGTYIIHWVGDARHETPNYCFEYAPYVDITCFSNMRDVDNMRSHGYSSRFLQIGYDPEIYYPDPNIGKDIDICFMGNHFGHFPLSQLRRDMVNELKRTYGDRFKAYGVGMRDGNFMSNQKGEADIYRRSKIGINLSHFDYPRYTSDRMFRMLGSGVCVLSHAYNNILDDFKGELVVWSDINSLKERIDYHLNDNIYRPVVANAGHQLALNNYTFSQMAQNIIQPWKNRDEGGNV